MVKTSTSNKKKNENSGNSSGLVRIGYKLLLIFITVFLFSQSLRSIELTNEKLNIFELAQNEVDQLRLKNIALLDNKEEAVSDDYIETVARDRLNYSRKGEIAFVIPEDVIDDPKIDAYIMQFEGYSVGEVSNGVENVGFWRVWFDFILSGV